ncbi:glycogen synthase GlgA [Magnetofaba australis]|uniref:Glycogen synthase n=1 Tax=Magnetofaba australis IT-1 TaxID=1434232 RepID=A0A1Y2K4Y4_9PROT|nr:glycogen synthase GlgA [Magnetofaba australis]OSM04296.1 putative glycogen/starch synthase [Magnetofaba australis IT-1]
MKILHVASELRPISQTGGLGDVAAALPQAQRASGLDAQVMTPAYSGVLEKVKIDGNPIELGDLLGCGPVQLLRGQLSEQGVPLWLVDCPALFDREGGPYLDAEGEAWLDNALRFAALSLCAAMLAESGGMLGWKPDVVHAHDWQAGLVAPYLNVRNPNIPTVFTIHNLQYQGCFEADWLEKLNLPSSLFGVHGLEFHGELSFLKGGLYYSHALTTVSPTYADEIRTAAFGHGLEGLLTARSHALTGILNGIDMAQWDPQTDPHIAAPFSAGDLAGKAACKADIQAHFGLDQRAAAPLLGVVSRLAQQKGLDMLPPLVPALIARGAQLVVLGTGEAELETAYRSLAEAHPGAVAAHIGYDNALSHRIQAGVDMLLIPSRFEPCGLTQMYAMRYGTLPVARRTGGLADSIVDWSAPEPTGFLFDTPGMPGLKVALHRGLDAYYDQQEAWRAAQRRAMGLDLSWQNAATAYAALYARLLQGA